MPGIEVRQSPGLITVIVYGEEILNLYHNIINVLFVVEMCDVIRAGTHHEQKAHEVIFGSQYCLIFTKRIKTVLYEAIDVTLI